MQTLKTKAENRKHDPSMLESSLLSNLGHKEPKANIKTGQERKIYKETRS